MSSAGKVPLQGFTQGGKVKVQVNEEVLQLIRAMIRSTLTNAATNEPDTVSSSAEYPFQEKERRQDAPTC